MNIDPQVENLTNYLNEQNANPDFSALVILFDERANDAAFFRFQGREEMIAQIMNQVMQKDHALVKIISLAMSYFLKDAQNSEVLSGGPADSAQNTFPEETEVKITAIHENGDAMEKHVFGLKEVHNINVGGYDIPGHWEPSPKNQ